MFNFAINFVSTTKMTKFQIFNDECNHILSIIINTESCENDIAFVLKIDYLHEYKLPEAVIY